MAWPQTGDIHVNLNLRSGPGTGSPILRLIPKNSTVTVTGPPTADGWYPVSYGGVTGYSKASYFDALKPVGSTQLPGTVAGSLSSPFYNPASKYGAATNSAGTKLVTDTSTVDQEREAWMTGQGFGGMRGIDRAAQSLAPRLDAGYDAAKLNNPGLKPHAYFGTLGKSFISKALARMTPGQRNESYATKNPFVRSTPR